mmetsp:Transcript_90945/g.199203  ORF Transcript_90945/g.199203 Transcript_90945/m.199203 type:complete len:244 (+) Transcript_90945:429-1160(+)
MRRQMRCMTKAGPPRRRWRRRRLALAPEKTPSETGRAWAPAECEVLARPNQPSAHEWIDREENMAVVLLCKVVVLAVPGQILVGPRLVVSLSPTQKRRLSLGACCRNRRWSSLPPPSPVASSTPAPARISPPPPPSPPPWGAAPSRRGARPRSCPRRDSRCPLSKHSRSGFSQSKRKLFVWASLAFSTRAVCSSSLLSSSVIGWTAGTDPPATAISTSRMQGWSCGICIALTSAARALSSCTR